MPSSQMLNRNFGIQIEKNRKWDNGFFQKKLLLSANPMYYKIRFWGY